MRSRILTDEEGIRQLADSWNSLCSNPNSDLEHYLLVCRLRKEVLSPWVFSLEDGGECKAIIAGRIEETVLRPRIGYLRVPGVRVRSLIIIHEGVLGEVGREEAEAFCEALSRVLRERQIQVVAFHHLSERHSGLWEALRGFRHSLGLESPMWSVHRALTMGEEPDFLLRRLSSKHRSWIKNRERRLKEAFEGDVRWIWHRDFNEVTEICSKMEAVASKTYQRGLGAGFIDNDETRQRLSLFAKRGMLRVMLAEVKGRPAGFEYGIVHKGTFYAAATGYLPEVAKYRVGTLTLLKTIEQLSREGISRLDYGLGDADYKKRFSDIEWREATFHIFASDWKGKTLRNYMAIVNTIDQKLRRVASQTGSLQRIKKGWRNLLRRTA